MRIRTILIGFTFAAAFPVGRAVAQAGDVAVARRITAITAVALQEYALGVSSGRIVSQTELEEARSFLDEARRNAGDLSPEIRSLTAPVLDEVSAGLRDLRPASELEILMGRLRHQLESSLSAALDPMPAESPSLARAARLFHARCAECHGEQGRGDGPKAHRLDPPPANFSLRDSLTGVSPLDFYRKITVGVAGTEMPDWERLVSLQDRWALALYVSGLRFSDAERARGDSILRSRCDSCRTFLSDLSGTAELTDDSLKRVMAGQMNGIPNDTDAVAVVAFARTAAAAEALGGDRMMEVARTLERTGEHLDQAVALADAGDRKAAVDAALDAYLAFERIETPLRARDARSATSVEGAFRDLSGKLFAGTGPEIARARQQVDSSLAAAERSLSRETAAGMLFGQSFVIMLREGLEAILIVGALMAFVVKAGAPGRKRDMGWGVLAAVGASLVTAVVLATVFRESTAHREALEGFIMLLAAGVLFSVSYWLVSKIEVRKWHSFVHSQIQRALSSRRTLALSAVAFLAVYREGFETVLFYGALFASERGAVGGSAAIMSGMVLGLMVLGAIYYVIQRYGVRLPLKPFFGITSGLLYFMAFSFAGQGISDLQEAGYIGATPLRWAPSLPALGIFPTTQTLAAQLLLTVALLAALAWIFWLEPKKA
ncbi:MAG: cytochrome c/FTR1 family iron permease [Gemmatimonadetes bacterium]|nr:cytochrome c/FTR1 family iron permease [Gemmatimonadota bacterium]